MTTKRLTTTTLAIPLTAGFVNGYVASAASSALTAGEKNLPKISPVVSQNVSIGSGNLGNSPGRIPTNATPVKNSPNSALLLMNALASGGSKTTGSSNSNEKK